MRVENREKRRSVIRERGSKDGVREEEKCE